MKKRLKDIVLYSNSRKPISEVTLDNYVTTDNLLQNKKGKTTADSLPPNATTTMSYDENNILISNIRPYLKKIWFADRSGGNSADVLVLKVKESYNPEYIYYSVFQDRFFEHMMLGAKGTKMPRGDKNQILNYKLFVPSWEEQNSIAKVLSSLDSKIQLNNQINQQLEEMAKTIYDYWFVQFDFPNEEGEPYKSSGGKMVYNKQLRREIPEGWEVKDLSDVANIVMGQSPAGKSYNDEGKGEIFFQGSTDFGWRFPEIRQYTTEPNRMALAGDILLSVRAPVGTLNIASDNCCIGRGLSAIRSKDRYNSFLYNALMWHQKAFEIRNNIGTTFGAITRDDLFSLKIIYPSKKHLERFNDIAQPIDEKILVNHRENQQLSSLRDWLLPMLMNGQVTVRE